MTYGDSVWTGDGWVGRICADPELTVILHETAEAHPTEEAAWLAACSDWSAIGDATPEARTEEAA